ncbi:glycoside hydrolase family 71/99-like protein [Rubinisphaera margarita]|uniref:glycoside hydrolase family 71/99-like protein n=1 Tax=Rubinisphaera margarita TaxID=2909586 RepID=UPI001EE7BB2F|nr:glycoside hydrolase family 71/99-like protein [Rubinisphaera margarita]MCG6155753.1 glycoside hydrolase family 71/99-like protein [Rubinisphaera margarita]
MKFRLLLIVALLSCFPMLCRAAEPGPQFLVHYMPWYQAKPFSESWGWHWTMNHFDPETTENGKRQIASKYYPLIGPYDSADPDVLEYQTALMKLSGIDGVIVDWYGRTDLWDYAQLHRNTELLIEAARKAELGVVICYEDQTIPALVKEGRLKESERVSHAAGEIRWLTEKWFQLDNYVRLDGKPVLLSFGQSGLTNDEWSVCLQSVEMPIAYFSQNHRRAAAVGAFDWPLPQQGLKAIERFENTSRDWPHRIPVAFPRFVDIYAEAGVHESWGRIDDASGRTFQTTFRQALAMSPELIQIATWNDWGEGTQIEPSVEIGYRDLEVLQSWKRSRQDSFTASPADLRLPQQLLELRRTGEMPDKLLDQIHTHLIRGEIEQARQLFPNAD